MNNKKRYRSGARMSRQGGGGGGGGGHGGHTERY